MNESLNDIFLKENKFIFKKYKPIRKIGEGSFGKIYSVIKLTDQSVFSMKAEKINTKEKMIESEAYTLYNLQKGFGIPKLISYGIIKNYNILIETLLGESLENIFIKKESKCNITDVCSAGIQIIDRLEWIHSNNLVYRDIKPKNFFVGIKDPNVIYIIDFGLCIYKKKITSSKLFEWTYLKETNAFGNLFNGLPSEFNEFIKYTANLKFEEDPNYLYLRSILKKIIVINIFIKGRCNFNFINNTSLYSSKSFDRKKLSLHQRVIQSLEEKRNEEVKSVRLFRLKSINKLNQNNYSLCIFNSNSNHFDSSLYNYRTLNNSKEEENISKKDNYKTKKIFSIAQRYKYNLHKYLITNINTLNNCSLNIKENNKNKIMEDSLLIKKISLINKQQRKRIFQNKLSNNNSKNSNSNNPVSVRILIPKNNLAAPINLSYNSIRQNNIIKQRIQLLNGKNKNVRNNMPKVISKIKFKNYNCHNSLKNNSRTNEKMK